MIRRVRWAAALLGAAAAIAGALAFGVERGWVILQDPPLSEFPIRGLDVSHHQGPIDWTAVAREGRWRFVWIKASEGGDWVDPALARNWGGALAAGLDVGAYHYFTLCTPGVAQAEHFLATIPAGARLPPAVDLERIGNCGHPPDPGSTRAEIRAFLTVVEGRLARPVVVYTTREFHDRVLLDSTADHPLWLRDVVFRPTVLDGRPWDVWQHLSRGRVAGIAGFVDEDVFRGGEAEYAAFRDQTL